MLKIVLAVCLSLMQLIEIVSTVTGARGKLFDGGCYCFGMRYLLTGPLRGILICHSDDCRCLAGVSWMSTRAYDDHYRILCRTTNAW